MQSPYDGLPSSQWLERTAQILQMYPVSREELVEVVLEQWSSIFDSEIGTNGLKIGTHMFPRPQIMGDYLHELIPYELAKRYPGKWRRDETGADKDLVWIEDPDRWSTEIKTSSHKSQVFGNRSYAQPGESRKSKSGLYLTVNFESWTGAHGSRPAVRVIRLGWLDYTDWVAQASETGQQAHIRPEAYAGKLEVLYRI